MIRIQWKPSQKQWEAFQYLTDKTTTEVLYGGGAGGGKSFLGCVWIVYCCLAYPGTRYLMGRAILKTLKESTLLTLFKVLKDFGLKKNKDYKYNSIESVLTFTNESEIRLKDLFAYPSDPEFDELGSTEYTAAFIDEASQVSPKAYQIVMSRLRYRLDEYNLIPKILTATNPTKNFLYMEFYKPFKENTLQKYRKFIPALVQDNPYISKHYIENLNKLDQISKERLLYGNWEYDDDPARLIDYNRLLELFNIPCDMTLKPVYYLSCDIARLGADRTVLIVWRNLFIEKIISFNKKTLDYTIEEISKLINQYGIPKTRVIVDEDGVGGGVVDALKVSGFVNNSSPIEVNLVKLNFANLKSQCYFMLADYINDKKIGCYKDIKPEYKKLVIEDLEQVKRKDPDKDGKLAVVPKEEIKENIGRSPDFGDALMMRMYFELKGTYRPFIAK